MQKNAPHLPAEFYAFIAQGKRSCRNAN